MASTSGAPRRADGGVFISYRRGTVASNVAGRLAERLTSLGLEVDGVQRLGDDLDKVIVGRVLEVSAHANADRLSVCRVDVGGEEQLQIVCGAPNVEAGGHYPLATVGALL